MGKSKQTKEKKFNRDVEISAPYLDPEIIKAIHSPPGRLDVKHAGFKALLSDLHSQDSTDEVQPLNEKHVPSYIGISCAVSGYTYQNIKKSTQGSTLGASITPNLSRANSPILFKSDPPIHHITIDKNNLQSPDDERKELTEKLTASANETLRACSPGIPATEDDRHHGAYVGARYCPLPSPSQVPNKHIPLLGIDDDRATKNGESPAEDTNKVQQSIASLYGDDFKENWLESMSHKTKKEQTEPISAIVDKHPKDSVKLKSANSKSDKKQTKEDGKPKAPSDLTGKAKNFLSKMFRQSPTQQEPVEVASISINDEDNKPVSEPAKESNKSIEANESQQSEASTKSQSPADIPKAAELVTSKIDTAELRDDTKAEIASHNVTIEAAHDTAEMQQESSESPELNQDRAQADLITETSDSIEPDRKGVAESHSADAGVQPVDDNLIAETIAQQGEQQSHQELFDPLQPTMSELVNTSQRSMPEALVADLVSFSPEPQNNEQNIEEKLLVEQMSESAAAKLIEETGDTIECGTSKVATANQPSSDQGGLHYLDLLGIEKNFIKAKIEEAEKILAESETELDEETVGRLRSAIGKANLLITKKCKQFEGLCEANINQDLSGQFETHNDDLAGFWDMLSIQISDVRKSFETIWQTPEDDKQANDDKNEKPTKDKTLSQAGKPKLSAQKDQERREKLKEHINQMKQSKTVAGNGDEDLVNTTDALLTSADEPPKDLEVTPEQPEAAVHDGVQENQE